jgi:hypothetical protein
MPPPLAPQYGVNPSHAYGPSSTAQRGRQPQSDYRMPRDAGLNAASNPASNWYPRSSQVIPNSAERSVRINDTPSHTVLISFSLFTRRAERQSNVRTHCRHGYPTSNFLIQVLLMIHRLQRLHLPLPTVTQLASQDHLRILLPDHTYRSHQLDILLRTRRHLVWPPRQQQEATEISHPLRRTLHALPPPIPI